ncbi:MAG: hypothetical protein WBN97_10670 [Parvibaculum sp.]
MTIPQLERAAALATRLMTLAPGESEEAMTALAHVLARQPATASVALDATCARISEADRLVALSIACAVLAGRRKDPTDGATRFHLHTENPVWARNLSPKALIGRYFYYAP